MFALRSFMTAGLNRTWNQPWWRTVTTRAGSPKSNNHSLPSFLSEQSMSTPPDLPNSLQPYLGRSISKVANPMASYRRLGYILYHNRVRATIRANMYYEKPAVARRRVRMESNRKRFGALIRKKVALIMQMKQR